MKTWHLALGSMAVLAGALVAGSDAAQTGEKKVDNRVFELRTYYAADGKMDALHARFNLRIGLGGVARQSYRGLHEPFSLGDLQDLAALDAFTLLVDALARSHHAQCCACVAHSRARLGDGGESNIIGPDDVERLRDPAKRLAAWRRLITDTVESVTVGPAMTEDGRPSRLWDPRRIDIRFPEHHP